MKKIFLIVFLLSSFFNTNINIITINIHKHILINAQGVEQNISHTHGENLKIQVLYENRKNLEFFSINSFFEDYKKIYSFELLDFILKPPIFYFISIFQN